MIELNQDWVGLKLSGKRYHVSAKLGEGGMGYVYKAHDHHLDTDVVIKVPRRALVENEEFVRRFELEIRSLVKLSHPHIVKVTDVGEHDGLPFAVMQYLAGGSLEDRIPRASDDTPLPVEPDMLLGWIQQVGSALDFIHGQGYVHRDIKPGNILFDEHGNVYLSDFGVAKVVASAETDQRRNVTGTGMVMGTPDYMAPELIMGHDFDGRVDQYALAVMVHELLSGEPPFHGATPAAVMVQHTTQQPTGLHVLKPSVSEALSHVVLKALDKDPARRFSTCVEFASAVVHAARGASVTVGASVSASGVAPASPAVSRKTGLVCPRCDETLPLRPQHAGRRVKCPSCSAVLSVNGDLTSVTLADSSTAAQSARRTEVHGETTRTSAPARQAEAIRQFEAALSRQVASKELRSYYTAIEKLPLPVPEAVAEKYREAVRGRSLKTQKRSLRIAGCVAAAVLLVTLAGWGLGIWRHRANVNRQVEELRGKLAAAELEDAKNFSERVRKEQPKVYASAPFEAAVHDLDSAIAKEKLRRGEFEQLIEQLKHQAPEDIAAPDLERLAELAADKSERTEVQQLRDSRQAKLSRMVTEGLAQARRQYDELSSVRPLDGTALETLADELSGLLHRAKEASPALSQEGERLAAQLRHTIEEHKQNLGSGRYLDMLTDKIGDPTGYRSALLDLSETFSGTDTSRTFHQVAAESDLWTGSAAWSEYWADDSWKDPESITPKEAARLLIAGTELLKQHPNCPAAPEFERRKDYLSHIAARVDFEEKRIYASLITLLSDALIADLYMIELKDGTRYYLTSDPSNDPEIKNRKNHRFAINYLASFNRQTTRAGIERASVVYGGLAPHSALANSIRRALTEAEKRKTLNTTQWVPTFCSILEAIQRDTSSDPVIVVRMFRHTLEIAAKGSVAVRLAFKDHLTTLKETPIDPLVKWFDPKDESAKVWRVKAKNLMDRLPRVAHAQQTALDALASYHIPPNLHYEWLAWLRRDKHSGWRADGLKPSQQTGSFYVIVNHGQAGTAELHHVGDVADGTVTWGGTSDADVFREGRPLFFRSSQ